MGKLLDELKRRKVFRVAAVSAVLVLLAVGSQIPDRFTIYAQTNVADSPAGLIELWESGQTAFGQYVTGVPFTVETGRELAANPLLDYAFLNLEQDYNINSALDLAQGLQSGTEGTAMELLVRIDRKSVV